MENASKALLIAAAVLIAIVLVALGVKLLNSAEDTAGEAEKVADAIGDSMQGESSLLIGNQWIKKLLMII